VLFGRGQYQAALVSLRAVVRAVTGESPIPTPTPVTKAEAVSVAADLFDLLRIAVSAHHPTAFGRPAAA
jgi:hypothetical protein